MLFDFAGVVTSSPWGHLAAAGGGDLELLIGTYEEDTDHPWHRVERGELAITDWVVEIQALGLERGVEIDFTPLQALLGEMTVHQPIIDRVRSLREEGYRVGLITNNVREGSAAWRALVPVDDLFEVVVDSSEVGMRKPNPAIYLHALDLLGGVPPEAAVFLDDSPGNVEGARRAGLAGILVEDVDTALAELDELLSADELAG
ncbi:MAG TPA: HAD family phosphatase [Acidimicrobiales bacterium]|nr:HAD family phosphatase [Acidimicrobiales bacterium]